MSEGAAARSEFTVLDWLGFGVAALAEVFNVAFPFAIAPSFGKMFADFGSTLPALTQAAMSVWFPLALATIAFVPFALSLDGSRPIGVRRALVLGGAALGGGSAALLLIAMYAPIFRLAENIK